MFCLLKLAPAKHTASISIAAIIFSAGCSGPADRPSSAATTASSKIGSTAAVIDLERELAQAAKSKRPVALFVVDTSENDSETKSLKSSFEYAMPEAAKSGVLPLVLDLRVSRNRATAARFHITDSDTPLLVCLSPKGVIVSRLEHPTAFDRSFADLAERWPELDTRLTILQNDVDTKPGEPAAEWALAEFLLAQHNAWEAIPHLASVAHSGTADTNLRVKAWVELARAHLWIAEPEKARHEASDLMAVLGPKSPSALAGGKLVYAVDDARGKRLALAREEFRAVIAAAPESGYAKEAADALDDLSKEAP
jgi:hypothetical protein